MEKTDGRPPVNDYCFLLFTKGAGTTEAGFMAQSPHFIV